MIKSGYNIKQVPIWEDCINPYYSDIIIRVKNENMNIDKQVIPTTYTQYRFWVLFILEFVNTINDEDLSIGKVYLPEGDYTFTIQTRNNSLNAYEDRISELLTIEI